MSLRAERQQIPVRILAGASLSGEVNVGPGAIIGIMMPAAWTAAGIALHALVIPKVGATAEVFGAVQDEAGADFVLAAGPLANEFVALPPTKQLRGMGRIRVLSGTIAVPVNQVAQADFFLVVVL